MQKKRALFIGSLSSKNRVAVDGERVKSMAVLDGVIQSRHFDAVNVCDLGKNKILAFLKFIFLMLFRKYDYCIISKFPKGANTILKSISPLRGKNKLCKVIYFLIGRQLVAFSESDPAFAARLKRIEAIVVETNFIKKECVSFGFENVLVYPQIKSYPPYVSRHVRKDEEPIKAVYFSRISEEKGILDLLQTLENHGELSKAIDIDIWGAIQLSPNERREFENYLSYLEYVKYRGCFFGNDKEKYEFISGYDLHILPAKYEGMPGSIVEMHYAGVPTITSAYPGVDDVLNTNIGYIYNHGDNDDLAAKLVQICGNRQELFQKRALCIEESKKFGMDGFVVFLKEIFAERE